MTTFHINDVFFQYDQKDILRQLSITLNPNKIIGLIGSNGSGKTTLIRLLTGILKPTAGAIRFNNKLIQEFSLREIAQQISYVPQKNDFNLDYSVYDFVAFGRYPRKGFLPFLNKNDHEIILRSIEQTGLLHLKQQQISKLSGGEQQRALIARSLSTCSEWMILDEPTTGLDLKYILHFFQILKSLVSEQGKSILLSIHDLNHAIQFCDEILVMKKGQLLFYGYPTEPDFLPAIEDAYEITFKQSLQLQIEAMKLN